MELSPERSPILKFPRRGRRSLSHFPGLIITPRQPKFDLFGDFWRRLFLETRPEWCSPKKAKKYSGRRMLLHLLRPALVIKYLIYARRRAVDRVPILARFISLQAIEQYWP